MASFQPMDQGRQVTAFFVYGTLKPGGLYWPRIENLIVFWDNAEARGDLYDTGLGYPAAKFDGDGKIEGVRLYVAEANLPLVTKIIDEVESEGSEYRRIEIATLDGGKAIAYEWLLGTDGLARIEAY